MDITQIVMVTYYKPNAFEYCMRSLLKYTTVPFHLTIIDNSTGGIDNYLNAYINHPSITIRRNDSNIGKGRSFKKWFDQIAKTNDHFISIDSDLLLPQNWLEIMQQSYQLLKKLQPVGCLAPILVQRPGQTFADLVASSNLGMHKLDSSFSKIIDNVYSVRHVAGPLLLIDRKFYEQIDGYATTQLYGNDDGELCAAAARLKRFTGIVSNVHVVHMEVDEPVGYRIWKHANVNNPYVTKGFWDQ